MLSLQAEALSMLSSDAGRDFIQTLKTSGDSALGYYCEARVALLDADGPQGTKRAVRVLEEAEERGVALGPRGTALLISLLMKDHVQRYNFARLKRLYREIERSNGTVTPTLHAFRHAVLCYQVGEYAEGADRFRKLRDQSRRSGIAPLRVRDVWRDPLEPDEPRRTQARVTRITTEWRAEAYVDELRQPVPLRPRHFSPPPREREVIECVIRFEFNGPLAVPLRFEQREAPRPTRRRA